MSLSTDLESLVSSDSACEHLHGMAQVIAGGKCESESTQSAIGRIAGDAA